eukprot:6540752-Alexandrium_andersonii.AAC.1
MGHVAIGSGSVRAGSHLAKYLLEQWSWGHLSPQQIQGMSSHAVADIHSGHGLPELEALAAL